MTNSEAGGFRRSPVLPDGGTCDLLVIGGGVVGAGIARDAALRGLSTVLVEQRDFAAGTSSRSSRLLHGGLRYLAQGRFGLVREASLEKMRLSRMAPHLCQPLPFVFPVWRGSGWKRWQLSLGVVLYDWLCGGRNLGRSSTLAAAEVLEQVPGLRREGLEGATRHFDALTQDARLVIDTLKSAAEAGGVVRNYTSFVAATRDSVDWNCDLHDEVTGAPWRVRARVIVNAAGAWGGRFPQSALHLRLTKGVHLVIDRRRLPVVEAVIVPEGDRILFVIPWGERVILGTTDTEYSGDPGAVRPDLSDVEYILKVINSAFPTAKLGLDDVQATWAGVRPLIAPRQVKAGAPSDISRRHVIQMSQPGWMDVAGGKLTTFRLMAEQAVDLAGRFLGRRLPRSRTAETAIAPGRYSSIVPPGVERAVVEECCLSEWAIHADDVMQRRTAWAYYHSNQQAIVDRVVEWMAELLNWDLTRQEAERARCHDTALTGKLG